MVEAGHEMLSMDLTVSPEPVLDDDVWFFPHSTPRIPDVSEKMLIPKLSKISLPSCAEGFDSIECPWLDQASAEEWMNKWMLNQKTTSIVESLIPGQWFTTKLKAWHEMRGALRQRHMDFAAKRRRSAVDTDANDVVDLSEVKDVHDADGKGTPLYANFKYEDWLLLAWRYELHLLSHAFIRDVNDPDRQGIPEIHVPHYFQVYYKMPCQPRKLNANSVEEALKVLREPVKLVNKGGKCRLLQSTLGDDASLEDFLMSVEQYRRDRFRRIDAGDESAQLKFPKAPSTAPPAGAKAALPASHQKAGHPPAKGQGKSVTKAVPLTKAPAKGYGENPSPVANQGLKRPPSSPASGQTVLKRTRPDGSVAPSLGKAPIVKRKAVP